MSDFTIVGIHLADQVPMAHKLQLLCRFDVKVRGFQLLGCSLLKTGKAEFIIWGPTRYVLFEEEPLRRRITDAVRQRYTAFGGRYDVSHTSPGDKPRDVGDVLKSFARRTQ